MEEKRVFEEPEVITYDREELEIRVVRTTLEKSLIE
jgi:hypothetical protein